MLSLDAVAPAFIEMAHRIVYATVATVAPDGRPWTRILHPYWDWDGAELVGWVATVPTPLKVRHLAHQPNISGTYWHPDQDNCSFNGIAEWRDDRDTRRLVWSLFKNAPPPVGYDPSIISGWDNADSEGFRPLRITPTRLRVMPGAGMTNPESGSWILTWDANAPVDF